MKFTVGYSSMHDKEYLDYIVQNKDKIYEVYFSWGDIPNGRNNQLVNENMYPWQVTNKQISDLKFLYENEIKLNLLLNANCYGEESLSRAFFNRIGDLIDYLFLSFGLSSITTTSPIIAKFVKNNFPDINVRASVNMEIGTIMGMEYLSDYFDGFYMKKENNRRHQEIKTLKSWCDENNKQLFMLANSGCLNNCSAHTYHNNLVAHETNLNKYDNAYQFSGICWEHLKKEGNILSEIKDTNFVRPEDIYLYEDYFTAAKLATRISNNPIKILRAYFEKKYSGPLLDLLEPNHSSVFYPHIIENSKIPSDFAKKVMECKKNCQQCDYCKTVLENAKVLL